MGMDGLLWRMGAAVCHQMAARSFFGAGGQMPLCARCTGLYTGAFLAFAFFFWRKRLGGNCPFAKREMLLTVAALLPLAVDGAGSYLGFWESNQLSRVLSGGLAGVALPALLLLAGNFSPAGKNESLIYASGKELPLLLAIGCGWGLCLWLGVPLYGVGAVMAALGQVAFWGGVLRLLSMPLPLGKARWAVCLPVAAGLLYGIGGLLL